MKTLFLICITALLSYSVYATDLILVKTVDHESTASLFENQDMVIHYYTDDFVIATSASKPAGSIFLAPQAFSNPSVYYFILWQDPQDHGEEYLAAIEDHATILYSSDEFLIVSAPSAEVPHLHPAIHGGMVRITDRAARLPVTSDGTGGVTFRADIGAMLTEVDQDTLQAMVQHLENYGTRNAYTPQSVQAQDWIYDKFASYGLDVELHDFSMPGGAASDNVIATLTGTKYPDEYVVLGAHYDSYSFSGGAPGADDNATGTAGILEAARIMSQHSFDRSIIFATWSGEEYGLYGSEAWASEAAADGMNILGYFNMDMAGYLAPGEEIHTDIIAPASADGLRQFYKDVCEVYLPDFGVYDGALSGGDSDHTSFNQNGYMGIFPFEDSQNYSPHIHTSNDIIGPSVNSFEMHATFTQAIIANVATMSDRLPAPENLLAVAGDGEVSLMWTGVDSIDYYNVYRNEDTIAYDTSFSAEYTDTDVVNGTSYSYYVTAVFSGSGEESDPSNIVTATPMIPIALPFFDDYETGAPYWSFEQDWGLAENIYHSVYHSMTESPEGEYEANLEASATLRSVNLSGTSTAGLSFWNRYRIEEDYDFMYLEVSRDGANWDTLDSFTGNQYNWAQKSYSLDDYVNEQNLLIRFRFLSDSYVEDQGMFIDDLEITIDGVGIDIPGSPHDGLHVLIKPNPAKDNASVIFRLDRAQMINIDLFTTSGQQVMGMAQQAYPAGTHQVDLNINGLTPGNYVLIITSGTQKSSRMITITK